MLVGGRGSTLLIWEKKHTVRINHNVITLHVHILRDVQVRGKTPNVACIAVVPVPIHTISPTRGCLRSPRQLARKHVAKSLVCSCCAVLSCA